MKCKKGYKLDDGMCVKKTREIYHSHSTSYNGGIGFLGFLTLIFITLKLTNVINWSWWWVLAPLWIPIALGIIIFIIFFVIIRSLV